MGDLFIFTVQIGRILGGVIGGNIVFTIAVIVIVTCVVSLLKIAMKRVPNSNVTAYMC